MYGTQLKATKVKCCVAQAVRTYYNDGLVTGTEVSRGNIYENDIQRIQCVSFIVSLGTAAVSGCPVAVHAFYSIKLPCSVRK